jgi:UDP-glucose 4-epimerase
VLNRGRNVIVVTGAGGFLGSRVVPLVRRHAAHARLITVLRRRRPHARVAPGVEVIHGDLRLPAVWRRLPTSVTHVIHLAAAIPWDRRDAKRSSVILDNVAPIAHLLDASTQWTNLRHIVYGSSVSVYAPSGKLLRESSATAPASVYGAAKLAGEQLLEPLAARGVTVAALRYSSIYGAGQYPGTVLPLLADRARRGLPLHVFNGRRVQDFLHVDDAARATWLASRRAARGAFNVGSGRPVSMSTLAREIIEAFDRAATSRVIEEARAAGSDAGIRMDVGRARRALGFRARIDLRDGLRRLAREALS